MDDPQFAEKIKANARGTMLNSFTVTKHVETLLANIEGLKNEQGK